MSLVDTSNLTLSEKGYLVETLTREIIKEIASKEFRCRSKEHNRKAGALLSFRDHYIESAKIIRNYAETSDKLNTLHKEESAK